MAKGKKRCPSCQAENSARSFKCVGCGYQFVKTIASSAIKKIKDKIIKKKYGFEKVDWKNLVPGTIIKVSGGPYYIAKEEKHLMGYVGTFKVMRVEEEGILATPIKAKESGMCFIYLGAKKSTSYGMVKRPHRIVKVNEKV
jgi:adenine specific DNA methylase Mod